MFCKVIYNKMVIDVLKNPVFLRYIQSSKRFRETDEGSANAVFSSDYSEKYHLVNTTAILSGQNYKDVSLVEISEAEYNSIKATIVESAVDEDGNTVSMQELRDRKIEEMKETCNAVITSGFDIVLSDGVTYHFSLEMTDQVKISKLADRANSGMELLPWHADDGLCKFYPAEDILAVNTMMENMVEFQTTYFNSLKNYIKNMDDKNSIIYAYYGMNVPEAYQSEVLKAINAQIGAGNETNS